MLFTRTIIYQGTDEAIKELKTRLVNDGEWELPNGVLMGIVSDPRVTEGQDKLFRDSRVRRLRRQGD